MYLEDYRLRELPFSLTPDTHYYIAYPGHRQALEMLMFAIASGDGFVKLVGDIGTGKTLLCRKLLNDLGDDCATVYIPNPMLKAAELKRQLLVEMGVSELDREADQNKKKRPKEAEESSLERVYQQVIELARAGKRLVIVVDEAQSMPIKTLECLRLLANLETEKRKLMTIVLVGQPELEKVLKSSKLRQLRQRISYSAHLSRLSWSESSNYLEQRVQRAKQCASDEVQGTASGELLVGEPVGHFTYAARLQLHVASRGVPRLLNLLAHKALLISAGHGQHQVNLRCVSRAIAHTEDSYWLGRCIGWLRYGWLALLGSLSTLALVGAHSLWVAA